MTSEHERPLEFAAAAPVTDPLTGLADRHEFARRLAALLADPNPEHRAVSLFAINLDGFRRLNTIHGCAVGDQVLKTVAERLLSEAAGCGVVARLAPDEFAVISGPPAPSPAETQAFAARLARSVERPMAVGSCSLRVTAAIATMTTVASQREADDALRDLDLTLQRAKSLGPSRIVAWEPVLTSAAIRRHLLAEELRHAFDNGELVLHYQPILELSTERMVGAEALLRWNHPRDGLVASAAFLPALEETGLIVEVGAWAIRDAIRQVESWRLLYGRDIVEWVSVNLSPRQLDDLEPLLASLRCVDAGNVSASRLKLEIGDAALRRNRGATRAMIDAIEELGVGLAIDDFGGGPLSLGSVRRYPVDAIKIGGGFIAQIGTTEGDMLVRTLLDIARMHGAAVIAEGIETAAQRDFLRAGGCGLGQGYLFAEAMDRALLGAYALTHTETVAQPTARGGQTVRLRDRPPSRGPLRAG